MPLKSDTPDLPPLNLTPMIDVLLVLVIFFVVAARFTEEAQSQQFDVELPTASPVQAMSRQPDPLVVSVGRSGRINFNNRDLTLEQLQAELRKAKEVYADQAVLIRGDGEGQYQAVVDVMNACHQIQIKRFSLAFQPMETATP